MVYGTHRVDIEVLFDRFLSRIYKLIDNQLQLVQNNNTSAKVVSLTTLILMLWGFGLGLSNLIAALY
jgi:hypothetical protein